MDFPWRKSWKLRHWKRCCPAEQTMNVAAYARVSTRDGDQDPETQLFGLRQYAAQRGWVIVHEYVDQASATDLRGRIAWRDLLEHVRKGGLDLVLVTKLDRAFRSAKDTYDNLSYLDSHKVGFLATTQPIDTSTSTGKLLLGVLAAVAEFEKALIIERTKDLVVKIKGRGLNEVTYSGGPIKQTG